MWQLIGLILIIPIIILRQIWLILNFKTLDFVLGLCDTNIVLIIIKANSLKQYYKSQFGSSNNWRYRYYPIIQGQDGSLHNAMVYGSVASQCRNEDSILQEFAASPSDFVTASPQASLLENYSDMQPRDGIAAVSLSQAIGSSHRQGNATAVGLSAASNFFETANHRSSSNDSSDSNHVRLAWLRRVLFFSHF